MSGAGSTGAGFYGAGVPAPTAAAVANTARTPTGLYLDLSVMDFPLDADGRYVEIHNVDHLALMLIGPNNPLWKDLPISDEGDMTRRANEIVRARWAKLISAGDIKDIVVRASPRANGGANIFVQFFNTRDPAAKTSSTYTVDI